MDYLQIPEKLVCRQGTVCSGLEGLLILLKRLAYPCQFTDMTHRFGRKDTGIITFISAIILNHDNMTIARNKMTKYLFNFYII